ncbi:MAG TPA: 16S rRNA (guanine(527)-N(7))-methyltransferase RsmG [Nevskiaceae bacterium]|nr:16S rRNA (guanine(527)-N(7))-methyltransferase RsmG [Nevskiaceae bacterium]
MRRTADPRSRLAAGLAELSLDAGLAAPLTAYLAELSKWNRAYNLTAVRDVSAMVTRHVLDSLAILPAIAPHLPGAPTLRILDVGSGAGLPGIPLAIARPGWHVTLLDSNGKKARFLRHAVRTLGLPNVAVLEQRAEALSRLPRAGEGNAREAGEGPSREPYDVIVSRAYASLSDFVHATHAALAPGGVWLAMKGKLDPFELSALLDTVRVVATPTVTVPGLDEDRHVVVMRQ